MGIRRFIKDQSFTRFNELAMLAYNLRVAEKKYAKYHDPKDEPEVIAAQQQLDNWFERWTEKIPLEKDEKK